MCLAVGVKTNLHAAGTQGFGNFDSAGDFSQVIGAVPQLIAPGLSSIVVVLSLLPAGRSPNIIPFGPTHKYFISEAIYVSETVSGGRISRANCQDWL